MFRYMANVGVVVFLGEVETDRRHPYSSGGGIGYSKLIHSFSVGMAATN